MSEGFELAQLLAFLSTAGALLVLERVPAWRRQPVPMSVRWPSNIGLFLIGSAVGSVLIPVGVYAFAHSQAAGGLLERSGLPAWAQGVLAFLLLDFVRYWQHRWFHQLSLLWRMHSVHHSDTQVDVTTSERHHPLEALLGTALLLALIAALGLPAPAVGIYLLVATVVTLVSHANLVLPVKWDRRLRRLLVTPRVHAIHHASHQPQTDSNYGTVLTLWDRCFGSYTEPDSSRIGRFGLDYFRRANGGGLGHTLLQPFLPHDASPAEDAATPGYPAGIAALTPRWRSALPFALAGSALLMAVMWPALVTLTAAWGHNEAYQYAWLVLPMLVYLLGWQDRLRALAAEPQPDWRGIGLALGAALIGVAAELMNVDLGRQFALVLALHGLAWSVWGWTVYRQLLPALCLLLLMIPSGDLLQPLLRGLTLKAVEGLTVLASLPHSVDGFVILIGANRYIVVDECSGLAFVTLGLFLGYCFGLLLYRSTLKIAALAVTGALLGVLTNVMRVDAIVLIDWWRGSQMALTAHGHLQWLALSLTLGLLFFTLSRLQPEPLPAARTSAPMPASAPPTQRWAPMAAGLAVAALVGGTAALRAGETHTARTSPLPAFPRDLAGWTLAEPAPIRTIDATGETETLTLHYRRDGRDLRVVIVEALSRDAKLSELNLAPPAQELWRDGRRQKHLACAADDCMTLLHTTWQRDQGSLLRHVYFSHVVGRFTTDSTLAFRALQGWRRLVGPAAPSRLIGFVSDETELDAAGLVAATRDLQAALDSSAR